MLRVVKKPNLKKISDKVSNNIRRKMPNLANETIVGTDSIKELIMTAKIAINGNITSIIAIIIDKVSNFR